MKNKNELEHRLNCEDRGPVQRFSVDGQTYQIYCCAWCMSTIHVVITTKGRAYACPQCVQILSYFVSPTRMRQKPSGGIRNRIKDMLNEPWEDKNGNEHGDAL